MNDERALVARAIAQSPEALRELMQRCAPVIRHRVTRALRARAAQAGAETRRSDVLDLTQEIFVILLDREARVLRSWDPERGLSLLNFVGLVAEREVRAVLSSGRRSAWAERPTEPLALSEASRADGLEAEVSARQQVTQLLESVRGQLTPKGVQMFKALFVDERPIDDVAREFETTPSALYTFRSRLRQKLTDLSRPVIQGES